MASAASQAAAGDSLDRFQTENYYEPKSVRDRDATITQFGRKSPVEHRIEDESFRVWPRSGTSYGPPTGFQPGASFQCLRDSGKLVTGEKQVNPAMQQKHLMPGYTGFIRGHQHISGRSYGEMTRRAYNTPYEELVTTSPIPSEPQKNRKIQQDDLPNSYMYQVLQGKPYLLPNYTGHVPGARHCYARSHGEITRQMMAEHAKNHPRAPAQEAAGQAATSTCRMRLDVNSAPVPGSHNKTKPVKLVPENVRYLKYFAI